MNKSSTRPEASPSRAPGSGVLRLDESLAARITRLRERTSVDGWKGPGSERVADQTWDAASHIITMAAVECDLHVDPFISAGANGALFLRWGMAPQPVVDVEITPSGGFEWLTGEVEGEGSRSDVLQVLREFSNRLR